MAQHMDGIKASVVLRPYPHLGQPALAGVDQNHFNPGPHAIHQRLVTGHCGINEGHFLASTVLRRVDCAHRDGGRCGFSGRRLNRYRCWCPFGLLCDRCSMRAGIGVSRWLDGVSDIRHSRSACPVKHQPRFQRQRHWTGTLQPTAGDLGAEH